MKVLGISFGRKMRCCEILVKQALKGAEEQGNDVRFMRAINMNIGHCTGCGACSNLRNKDQLPRCILKDDYEIMAQAVLDADVVIVAAPVYVLGPVGQFKNFVDRFGPAHDRAAVNAHDAKRAAQGLPPLDPRETKPRYVSYISAGGAYTPNWVSFGLPLLHLFGFSSLMVPVDQLDALDMGRTASPFLDAALMERALQLGKNTAQAAAAQLPANAAWRGDPGVCPVCHCNLLTVGTTTAVECPVCGIAGTLSVSGTQLKVTFSEAEQNRARGTLAGMQEHFDEIEGMKRVCIPKLQAHGAEIAQKTAEYETLFTQGWAQ